MIQYNLTGALCLLPPGLHGERAGDAAEVGALAGPGGGKGSGRGFFARLPRRTLPSAASEVHVVWSGAAFEVLSSRRLRRC